MRIPTGPKIGDFSNPNLVEFRDPPSVSNIPHPDIPWSTFKNTNTLTLSLELNLIGLRWNQAQVFFQAPLESKQSDVITTAFC